MASPAGFQRDLSRVHWFKWPLPLPVHWAILRFNPLSPPVFLGNPSWGGGIGGWGEFRRFGFIPPLTARYGPLPSSGLPLFRAVRFFSRGLPLIHLFLFKFSPDALDRLFIENQRVPFRENKCNSLPVKPFQGTVRICCFKSIFSSVILNSQR